MSTLLSTAALRPAVGPRSSSSSGFWGRYEPFAVGALLALFLLLCSCIESRYIPWNDEVQFVDPAANLYSGAGFVSSEWSNQNDRSFWAGNAPGYPFLLFLTFKAFGFSQAAARSINYAAMALAVFLLWLAVRRAHLLRQAGTRLLLLLITLCGYGGYACYSNLRYDTLCFLECACALFAFTLRSPLLRNAGLFIAGVAMLLTNFQLLPYALFLAAIVLAVQRPGFFVFPRLALLGCGMLAGGLVLFSLYQSHPGALAAFRVTLQQQAGQSLAVKLRDLSAYFQYDLTQVAILLLLLSGLAISRGHGDKALRRTLLTGILVSTLLPAFFFLTRRYVFSSAWMATIPAAICLCRLLEANVSAARVWKAIVLLGCAAAIGAGLPRAGVAILNEWAIRDYAAVETFIAANLAASDVAYCDPSAYFAMRPRVARLYGPGYLDVISADEKRAITTIVVNPVAESETLARIGGDWIATQSLALEDAPRAARLLPWKSRFTCRLTVWRRRPDRALPAPSQRSNERPLIVR